MIFRVFDTETTGLPEEGKHVGLLQVGWTDVILKDGGATVGDTVQHYCNPFLGNPNLVIEIGAQATHHITKEDVADAKAPEIALRALGDGADAFACHNKEFDGRFFTGLGRPFICTLKAARRMWPDFEKHTNQYLRYALKLPVDRNQAEPSHHAGPDSYVTAHLLARMIDEGAELADLIDWSTQPNLQSICRFGNKWRGKPWDEVPTDYLQWMRDKATDIDADTKFTVNWQLDKRGAL